MKMLITEQKEKSDHFNNVGWNLTVMLKTFTEM